MRSGACASTTWTSISPTFHPAFHRRHDVDDRRPGPAGTWLPAAGPGRTGGPCPASLPRPAAAGGCDDARDPARDGQVAPVSRAPCHAGGARRQQWHDPRHPRRTTCMNPVDSFERDVANWMGGDAEGRVPAHLDTVLRRTRSERQRPAWSSLERWLPMHTTFRAHVAPVPSLVWAVALSLLLLSAAAWLFAGAADRTPPRLRVMANGETAYVDGDRLMVSSADGTTVRPLMTLSEPIEDLAFSPDGTKIAFRTAGGVPSIIVADADGCGPGRRRGRCATRHRRANRMVPRRPAYGLHNGRCQGARHHRSHRSGRLGPKSSLRGCRGPDDRPLRSRVVARRPVDLVLHQRGRRVRVAWRRPSRRNDAYPVRRRR